MMPPDGAIIRFVKGFYTDRMYIVVSDGQLICLKNFEKVFWEFFRDGKHLGPLGEAKWRDDCEKLEVEWVLEGLVPAPLYDERDVETDHDGLRI